MILGSEARPLPRRSCLPVFTFFWQKVTLHFRKHWGPTQRPLPTPPQNYPKWRGPLPTFSPPRTLGSLVLAAASPQVSRDRPTKAVHGKTGLDIQEVFSCALDHWRWRSEILIPFSHSVVRFTLQQRHKVQSLLKVFVVWKSITVYVNNSWCHTYGRWYAPDHFFLLILY